MDGLIILIFFGGFIIISIAVMKFLEKTFPLSPKEMEEFKKMKAEGMFDDNNSGMFKHGVNGANGLPTINGIDIHGNPNGANFNHWGNKK